MKTIRKNVFETNSSSTHSICITKDDATVMKPNEVNFYIDEFGWECNTLNSIGEKASYLYTAILECEIEELIDYIKEVLDKHNIKYNFEKHKMKHGYLEYGYIDHGYELVDFLHDISSDENKLMRYLFSGESFVITGNDNDDYDVNINVSYDHDEYYKGN